MVSLATLISKFVVKSKQPRYLELLRTERGIEKFRLGLAHFRDFDTRFIVWIAPNKQTPSGIWRLLLDLGAPELCDVFAEARTHDGSGVRLKDALEAVVGSGLGTLIECRPGELAYYESEEASLRFVLRADH